MSAPLPEDESARLTALRRYAILDTPAEEAFDDITRLASLLCRTSISLINLIDEARQWCKSHVGIEVSETSRDLSFCAHTILQPNVFVVPNATQDARFAGNPLVTNDPYIRFYAGIPLLTHDGHALGTLCVMDPLPRSLPPQQRDALPILARLVVAQLERRQKTEEQQAFASQRQMEEALRASQERFEAFMNTSSLVAFMKDMHGHYLYVNKPFEVCFNIGLEDIWGTSDADWFPHDIAEQNRIEDETVRTSGNPLESIKVVPAPDGQSQTWRVYKFPFVDPSGQSYVGGVAVDITEQQRASVTLRRIENQFTEAQHIAHLGSWEFELASEEIFWSDETFRLLEFDPDLGVPSYEEITQRYHPNDRGMHHDVVQKCIQDGEPYEIELRVVLNDDSIRWLHAMGQAKRDDQGQIVRLFGTVRDITESKQQQQHLEATNVLLEALATTDGLTGLKNHRSFQEKLAQEFERSRRYHIPLSVILLDVDQFKPFNDTFGHPAGDVVLKQLADVLQTMVRTTDFVARYGGEEFIMTLPETEAQGAFDMAERIRKAIESQDWERRTITVSLGVATLTPMTSSPAALVEMADQSLYISKHNGRNQVTLYTLASEEQIKPQEGHSEQMVLVFATEQATNQPGGA